MSIKKMALSVALAGVVGATNAVAETSGAFFGVGFGTHKMSKKTDYNYNLILTNLNVKKQTSASGESVSFVVGYKMMSSANSGTRFYINYDYNGVEIKEENDKTSQSSYQVVGINADYLYNFNENFGLLVGANLGLINWDKKIWSLAPELDENEWKGYLAGQLGLRGIFGAKKNHALEFICKIPFTQTTIEYKNANGVKAGETKLKQDYNAGIRYIYTF